MFSLLRGRRTNSAHIHLSHIAIKDLQWWQIFLSSWSTVTIIQPSRANHDAATDASGLKGIGGIYNGQIFSERVPSRHRAKHINFKEMFAILYAFVLWHEQWATGRLRLACDNSAVVDRIKKLSIDGPAIHPLQTILLIAALFDIELTVFWVPSRENIVADAASRHDFEKLTNLGFQDQVNRLRHGSHVIPSIRMATLRQKLHTYFKTQSLQQLDEITSLFDSPTRPTVDSMGTRHSQHQQSPLHTGSLKPCTKSNHRQQKGTLMPCVPSTSNTINHSPPLTIPAWTSSFEEENDYMELGNVVPASLSQQTFLYALSEKPRPISTAPTSKHPSVWHLPDSFELENLHGKHGTSHPLSFTLHDDISHLIKTAQPLSYSPPLRQTPSAKGHQSTSLPPPLQYAQCEPFKLSLTHTRDNQMTPCSPVHSGPLTEPMSSTKSGNSYSLQESAQPVTQGTPSARAQPYQQQQTVLQKRKSSSLDDGKAMPSTSTSMKSPKRTKSKNSYT